MKSNRNSDLPLTKKLWQEKILPQLDGRALLAFSLMSDHASRLAERPIAALSLATNITHGKVGLSGGEVELKKRGTNLDYSHRTISQLLKILRCMPLRYRYLIPYILIMEVFEKHAEVYIKSVYRTLLKNVDERHFMHTTTSCINSAVSVMSILIGMNQIKSIHKMMGRRFVDYFEIELPSSKKWTFAVKNLFRGEALARYQRKNDNFLNDGFSDEQYNLHVVKPSNVFQERNSRCISYCYDSAVDDEDFISKAKKHIESYEYNGGTISSMRGLMTRNAESTHGNRSYIYYMTAMLRGGMCHHAFLIEQFYCSYTQSVRYRLYQSWIKKSSLYESVKAQFGTEPVHAWSYTDVYRFISRIELFYSTCNPGNISEFVAFGHGKTTPDKSSAAKFENNELSGTFFEYYCLPINPEDCLHHLNHFANEKPELKEAFKIK